MNNYIYALLFISLLILPFLYGYLERIWITTKNYQIKIDKQEFKGFKIAFLTDFHYSRYIPLSYLKKVIKITNQQRPDLIILGGDYISYNDKYIDSLFKELSKLHCPYGVYGVLGNHDVTVNKNKTLECMKKYNVQSLDNTSYWIQKGKEKIKLGGVGDYLFDKQIIGNTMENTTQNDFIILASHNPDYVEHIKNKKIDLMLSGHTHGGQITFFGLFAPVSPSKYLTGEYKVNQTKLIVSNGIGCVGLPFRFFARPQVVMIHLK